MIVYGATDKGKVRPNNEDNFAFGLLEDACYSVVCDGMGGVEGGEIASKIAVDTIKEKIELAYSPKMGMGAIERMLVSAVTAANVKIYDYACEHDLRGMGTTAVAAIVKDDCVYIAYDGDSRAYVLNDDIRLLTTDHTYLNELLRLGRITEEQMQKDPRKHIITRALGVSESIDVDTVIEDISPGDAILLCSDGVYNCLSDEQLLEIYRQSDAEDISQQYIRKANDNGGIDNITLTIMINQEEKNG